VANSGIVVPVTACRACGGAALEKVLDLGRTPLANALVPAGCIAAEAPTYPLALAQCRDCALVQITCRVPGEVLFGRDYPYYSSTSPAYLAHAAEYARTLLATEALDAKSLVVEIASNDGYLLRNIVAAGVPALGIDPAAGPAAAAEAAGVPTLVAYFDAALAGRLAAEGRRADLVIANNVLAHVDDPADFVRGLEILLKPDCVAVLEVPSLVELVEGGAFDTIYHEHNCYFSLTALTRLFERQNLTVADVQGLSVQGGSFRLRVSRGHARGERVRELLAAEARLGVEKPEYLHKLAARVERTVRGLRALLAGLKAEGKRVAAYGAAAKGVTLASVAGLGPELIDYVVDRNPVKQGLWMPGSGLPVVTPERLDTDPPDYLLLFAWNLLDEIRDQLPGFAGRFIVPIPEPRLV
jgi:2-polyprenyl-3-methyl-5-hydroxy-6-metoxy-1,4-benzoquinol methylase